MYAIHTTVVYECLCAEGNQNIPQLHIIHLNFVSTHAGNFVCRWTPKKPTESFPGQPANISIARTEKRQEKAIFFWGGSCGLKDWTGMIRLLVPAEMVEQQVLKVRRIPCSHAKTANIPSKSTWCL